MAYQVGAQADKDYVQDFIKDEFTADCNQVDVFCERKMYWELMSINTCVIFQGSVIFPHDKKDPEPADDVNQIATTGVGLSK